MVIYNGNEIKYTGDNTKHVSFPIGGMGAGMFCMEGSGMFSSFSLHHKPDLQKEPWMFAAVTVQQNEGQNNQRISRVIEGQVPSHKVFTVAAKSDYLYGGGVGGKNYGLPRFTESEFSASFPFATVHMRDDEMPVTASATAWSPFIPGDEDSASLPVGGLEYTLSNATNDSVEGVFYFCAQNFYEQRINNWNHKKQTGLTLKDKNGFTFYQPNDTGKPHDLAWFRVTALEDAAVNTDWFRGGWFDILTMLWNDVLAGRHEDKENLEKTGPGGSIAIPFKLEKGESKTVRLCISWYVPNSDLREGPNLEDDWDQNDPVNYYQPWYAGRFAGIDELSAYWHKNYDDLKEKSAKFNQAFFAMTLPDVVMQSVVSNLSILKSPTVMRQKDGRFWAWEGTFDEWGSCYGSCTHVWNYQQALCHLFPALERSLRETEFHVSQNEEGRQTFRSSLPLRTPKFDFHAASDGQLGGIIKTYRDWRISGNDQWLISLWDKLEQSLAYCTKTWDPDERGVLTEPHHNTYDIEFWGDDAMCTTFYLGALLAASKMARYLGKDEKSAYYFSLYEKGKTILETELFNGEYFYQKIQWEGLRATLNTENEDEATKALLAKEGPKYQYGTGCISDGLMGAWMARMAGLGDILDPAKTASHLLSIYKYNLKHSLVGHSNPQRPGYALGNEGGLLLCTWPKGDKLSLPFVYSDEVWTGIEHQVASHLIGMGYVEEGLTIERLCRARYDGTVRNPMNEYECGSFYARAMASYALIESMTGIRYDACEQKLYVCAKITEDFTSFLATNTGFGTVAVAKNGNVIVTAVYGEILVKEVVYQ